jgi:hypothetical protein
MTKRTRANSDTRKLLWHYTDFRGLQGILDGSIWASSATFLNDAAELRHALLLAVQLINSDGPEIFNFERRGSRDSGARSEIVRYLEKFINGAERAGVFVTSLSARRDDLNQWRSYGGPGQKFAIGFDPSRLRIAAKKRGFILRRVLYENNQIVTAVRKVLNHENAYMLTGIDNVTALPWLLDSLSKIAARSKHVAFKDESEWRLVRAPPRPPNEQRFFRLGGSLVVPYIEVPLNEGIAATDCAREHPIVAVMAGPSPHPEKLAHGVKAMVFEKGLQHVDVMSSAVPFRIW